METNTAGPSGRKKRLSRREQRVRKKQRQDDPTQTSENPCPQVVHDDNFYAASYIPTPLPEAHGQIASTSSKRSLGKWFPKATILKSSVQYTNANLPDKSTTTASILLFYQYVVPQWTTEKVDQFSNYLLGIHKHRPNLGGRIRIAVEGCNATISAADVAEKNITAAATLRHFAMDLCRFDPVAFAETDFKYWDGCRADRHFSAFKVFPVQELVFYGLTEQDAPLNKTGTHLLPQDFHKMLAEPDAVVIDVRNHYEAALGRFDGQSSQNGAKYLDPKMRKSTDFTKWLEKPQTKEELKDKKVLLYCTGGVRCERASAYVNQQLGESVNGVYQLQGGIERYLQTFSDGGFWRGKNFVFDKREAVAAGDLDGDGGVLDKKKRKAAPDGIETKCCVCDKPWDRYVGKKKCSTCGVPVLMCDKCMSNKANNAPLVRCPLCVEENVTVPVEEVEYTDNGVSGKLKDRTEGDTGKAAPSVLKWGGGHASEKKEKRKFKRKPCKFGDDCIRPNCFFSHPKEASKQST